MDLRKLKTLIDLVSESNVSELEITENEGKVRIVKSVPVQTVAQNYIAPQMMPPTTAQSPIIPSAVAPEASTDNSNGIVIKSPMVGTFYAASAPGAEPFAKVGKSIQAGDTLCIIEAMKILNEIEAEQAGVISQILVENGQVVEYGQPLFIVE